MISYLILSEVFPLCLTVFFSLPYKTMPRSISFRHGLQVHDKCQGCLWALVTPPNPPLLVSLLWLLFFFFFFESNSLSSRRS